MHDYDGNPANNPAAISMLDDSDAPNATNFDTPLEGLADRTAWLTGGRSSPGQGWAPAWTSTAAFSSETVDAMVLLAIKKASLAGAAPYFTAWSTNAGLPPTTWTILAGAGALLVDPDAYEDGDWYNVTLTGTANVSAAIEATLALGSAIGGGPAIVQLVDSAQSILPQPGATGGFSSYPIALEATVQPGAQSGLVLGLLAYSGGAPVITMLGSWSMTLRHYRATTTVLAADPSEIENAAFDLNTNLWLAAVEVFDPYNNTWTPKVFRSYGLDGSAAWSLVGGAPLLTGNTDRIDCMAVSGDGAATSNAWAAVHQQSATFKVMVAGEASGTWLTKRNLSNGASNVEMIPGPTGTGSILYATASATVADVVLSSSLDGGATWHDFSPYVSLPGGANPRWLLKSNGPLVIACPAFFTPATPALFTTVDGLTWTSVPLAFLTGTKTVVGLTWSGAAGVWYLLVQLTTTTTALYSSPDGATWSVVGSGGPAGVLVADLAAYGNSLVATLFESTLGGPSGQIYSTDNGLTWPFSQATMPASGTDVGAGYSRPRLVAAPAGLLAFNNLWARFAGVSGTTKSTTANPPTLLP
jgi:hypothetical protein